jgi:hypothetical protein
MTKIVVAVLLVVIAWLVMKLTAPSVSVDASCTRPELASLTSEVPDESPACFYSRTYAEARTRFLQQVAASKLPFEVHSLPIGFKGLFIDIALLRRRSDALLMHLSGTHGTEGFVGSAIQTALLANTNESVGLPHAWFANAQLPSIMFVHALNPFGMANFRRWNEDGVDLNRNAIFSDALWNTVKTRGNAEYDAIDSLINSPEPPTLLSLLVRIPHIAYHFATRYVQTKRALVSATYTQNKGIFYGGQRLTASHQLLSEFLASSGFTTSAKHFTMIDVHSGLGPIGQDTLMFGENTKIGCDLFGAKTGVQPAPYACEGIGDPTFTEALSDDSASAGYENTVGTMSEAASYASLFTNVEKLNSLRLAQEFGTLPPVRVIMGLIRENQAFHFGDEETRRQHAQVIYDTFVPTTREARANTVRRGVVLFQQAVKHLMTK